METLRLTPEGNVHKSTDAEYRIMLDAVYEGLFEIPIGANEAEENRYREIQRDSIDTLAELILHPEFSDEAIRNLSAMALAIASEGKRIPGVTELDYENGERCRRILFAHKEILFEKVLREKHTPKWGAFVQLESIPGYQEEIQRYLKEEVEKCGLNLEEFEVAWAQAGTEEDYKDYRIYNIFQLLRLEKKNPGSSMELFRGFGIADFARYPLDVLEEQYENRDNIAEPYGIMLYPRSDWNGAFYGDEKLITGFHTSLAGKYQLRIVECESKWDIGKKLIALDKKYGVEDGGHKIAFAVVCGHGNKEVIDFGGTDQRHRLHISDLGGKGIERSATFFEENPTFVIFSCTTGVEGGVGQELSRALNATVIAPNCVTGPKSIEFITEPGEFSVRYKFDALTMKFKNGEVVSTAEEN